MVTFLSTKVQLAKIGIKWYKKIEYTGSTILHFSFVTVLFKIIYVIFINFRLVSILPCCCNLFWGIHKQHIKPVGRFHLKVCRCTLSHSLALALYSVDKIAFTIDGIFLSCLYLCTLWAHPCVPGRTSYKKLQFFS